MRFRILLAMTALLAVIVCVIAAASPYAPVVEPVREIEAMITQYVHELGDSGAYARDSERWEKGDFYPDGYNIVSFAYSRFEMMDAWVDALVP